MITDEIVTAAAEVLARSPCIDAPKLPAACWMGLARAALEAAEAAGMAKHRERAERW